MTVKVLCPRCKLIFFIKVKSGNLTVKCRLCGTFILVNGSVKILPEEDIPPIDPRHII